LYEKTVSTPFIAGGERIWLATLFISSIFGAFFFPLFLPTEGSPSLPSYIRADKEALLASYEKFIDKHGVGYVKSTPLVVPPPDADVYIKASRFRWEPQLILKKGVRYRLHLFSDDTLHGFNIHELKVRFETAPGYELVTYFTPAKTGLFNLLCDEFCGAGHHLMTGKVIVEP
jgi:cytochrome c oxidase subunit 2